MKNVRFYRLANILPFFCYMTAHIRSYATMCARVCCILFIYLCVSVPNDRCYMQRSIVQLVAVCRQQLVGFYGNGELKLLTHVIQKHNTACNIQQNRRTHMKLQEHTINTYTVATFYENQNSEHGPIQK